MAAVEYATKYGWRVFPCIAGEKIPATAHGFKDATTDADAIAAWPADCNVGIATGDGLFVLDVDRKEGRPDGMVALKALQEQHEPLPVTASVITPSGGRHYYFRVTKPYRNSASKIGPSLDVRCDGGYVVAPDSVVDGRLYRWAPGCTPDEAGVADLPAWLSGLSERREEGAAVAQSNGHIVSGGRNDALASLAGYLRNRNLHPSSIASALHTENTARCLPPLPPEEVDKIAAGILRYAPGTALHYSEQEEDEAPESDTHDPGVLPGELLDVPGFIGEVVQWNLRTAYRRQPGLALGAALAMLSALTGRKVADPHDTRTNLYIIGIGPSSSGKEHARRINKTVLHQSGQKHLLGPEDFASSTGLVNELAHRGCLLFQLDEIGRILKAINSPRSGAHMSGIITELLKLHSVSNSIYYGKAFADRKQNVEINQPHAVLYGTTVAENFFAGLTPEGLVDGFYGRLLAFTANMEDRQDDQEPVHTAPEDVLEAARFWGEFKPGGNLAGQNPQPLTIEYTEAARVAMRGYSATCECRLMTGGAQGSSAIWGRACEKASKLALLYACSECPTSPEVTSSAVEWATALVEHQTHWMLHMASQHVAENDTEAAVKKVLRIIVASGTRGLTQRELTRKTQWLKRQQRQDIVADLVSGGLIELRERKTTTKPAMVYAEKRQ